MIGRSKKYSTGDPAQTLGGRPCVALRTPTGSLFGYVFEDPRDNWVKDYSPGERWLDPGCLCSSRRPGPSLGLINSVFPYAGKREPKENRLAWLTRSQPVSRRAYAVRWIQVFHFGLLLVSEWLGGLWGTASPVCRPPAYGHWTTPPLLLFAKCVNGRHLHIFRWACA